MTVLSLVEDTAADVFTNTELFEARESAVTFCRCGSAIRPEETSLDQYPGTVPSWGNNQCRICDYSAAGRDPEDRFITQQRVSYLTGVREGIEAGRRRRGVPAGGSMPAGRMPISKLIAVIDSEGARK